MMIPGKTLIYLVSIIINIYKRNENFFKLISVVNLHLTVSSDYVYGQP